MKILLENWNNYLKESKRSLRLGLNTFSYGSIDITEIKREYPKLKWELENYLVLSMIETYEKGHFVSLMSMVEEFAKDNGYNGILLRAETQNINQRTQEDLIRLYERSGYSRYYPKIDMESYSDDDVFMRKVLQPLG